MKNLLLLLGILLLTSCTKEIEVVEAEPECNDCYAIEFKGSNAVDWSETSSCKHGELLKTRVTWTNGLNQIKWRTIVICGIEDPNDYIAKN